MKCPGCAWFLSQLGCTEPGSPAGVPLARLTIVCRDMAGRAAGHWGAELSPASRGLVFLLPAEPSPNNQWVLLISIDIRDIDVVVETGELGT